MNKDKEKIVYIDGKKVDISKLSNEELIKLANYNKNKLKEKMKPFDKNELER